MALAFMVCKMPPRRTLLIVVVFIFCVASIGGQFSQDRRKPESGSRNYSQARETAKVSGKVGDLAEVVTELKTEVRALKSELRGVQNGLSECTAGTAEARQAENDHVRVQWMQREMAETREEMKVKHNRDFFESILDNDVFCILFYNGVIFNVDPLQVRDRGVGRRLSLCHRG